MLLSSPNWDLLLLLVVNGDGGRVKVVCVVKKSRRVGGGGDVTLIGRFKTLQKLGEESLVLLSSPNCILLLLLIDWFNTGNLGDWFVDVSLGKYFVIGFCFSVTCFRLLSLINFFATFIHARMDCSFIWVNDVMSRPNHLFSGYDMV